MKRPIHPDDVPRRPRAVQVASLGDGRLLLRGEAGVTLLRGVDGGELRRLLDLVDGERTVGDIGTAFGDSATRLLHRLAGSVLSFAPRRAADHEPRPSEASVLVLGDGDAARRLAAGLGEAAATSVDHSATLDGCDPLAGRDLVVCAMEQASYGDLFEAQRTCLSAGVPALFVAFDADGVRVGPTVLPGTSPCFGCAQAASFRFLGLPPGRLLDALTPLRTGRLAEAGDGRTALRRALAEARRLLAAAETPTLLTAVALVTAGGERVVPVPPADGCPLCGEAESPTAGPPAFERDAHRASLAALARNRLVDLEERAPRRALPGSDAADAVRTVGILGGGTAGYLAALALACKLPHLEVTLIESSQVPIVGVGEATTPLMPQFLHADLDLSVQRLFREVRPTLKLGIRFAWGPPEIDAFHYPFGPLRLLEPQIHDGDVRRCSLRSMMMAAGAVPVSRDGRASLGTEVAYHLDNEPFVAYLTRLAARRGVRRVDARIAEVQTSGDGEEVRALIAEDGRRFAFDLYLDCSGFRSLLLEGALGSPFVSFSASLPTDRALVATVPHGGRVAPYTLAETVPGGWCWSTPQRDADHRGLVFSSAFTTPEAAEEEMRRLCPGMGEPRLVRFRSGRHRDFWKGNVVALGNAYGFVEPLESTALHMLIRQIGLLTSTFPRRRGERAAAALLNRRVGDYWDYLRWFLAIHYRFNRRLDSPFWRHCRAEVDVGSHAELLAAFAERGPLSYDPVLAAFDFPDPLWGAEGVDLILLGQRVPARLPRPRLDRAAWRARLRRREALVAGALSHKQALARFDEDPSSLERFVAPFLAAGPAFPAAGS